MTTIAIPTSIHSAPPPAPACQEHVFQSWDGAELFYRSWRGRKTARHALLLFHRGHEHSGRFAAMAEQIATDDVAIFAWDARGHGRSPGERGYANDFADVILDLDCFVRHISREYSIAIENMVVLGHSVAAVAVAAWVHDYGPPIAGMILATPAFRVKLYVPLAMAGLRALSLVRKKAFIKSYVKAKMLTHDAGQAADYAADPLISRQIAVNILLDLFDTSTRLLADAGAITTPTLVLSAGADWVVKNKPQEEFFDRLSSPVKRRVMLDGFHHAIFHETDRDYAIAEVREFVREQFKCGVDVSVGSALADADDPASIEGATTHGDTVRDEEHSASAKAATTAKFLFADRTGFTKQEFDRLSAPLPALSPRRISFALQRLFLHTFGRLSRGISLGWRTGFDSGQSLDYIYEKRARGFTPIGKLIDRVYLNAIGWRGIRQRKVHLQQLLRQAIERAGSGGNSVRLLDIAAGPGRYMLEVMKEIAGDRACAILRDHNPEPLEIGRAIASEMGLANVRYEVGDAFDTHALASILPRPDVAVVSGLYELFPDNGKVLASLRGLASALHEGRYLIYTNQPWHPQVEMIARVLRNRVGRPWVMRRRTQAEMDALVRSVGFDKVGMLVDRWGIFTVSLAVKRRQGTGAGESQ